LGPLAQDSLLTFERAYMEGSLKAHLKSAERVDDSEMAVKVIVSADFDERVIKSGKDVFLQFHAPWCGHCKALAPKFEELGLVFKEQKVESVVVAKMDATENDIDHPDVDIQGFPTLKLFLGKDPDHPVEYHGERETEAMLEFIKKEASVNFELHGQSHGRDEL